MKVIVGDYTIESKMTIRYLEVVIGVRMNFIHHVEFVGRRAFVTQVVLTRITLNIGGLNTFNRRIAARVIISLIVYACPIWLKVLFVVTTRRNFSLVYGLSEIWMISNFRTVCEVALLVFAKSKPWPIRWGGYIFDGLQRRNDGLLCVKWQSSWEDESYALSLIFPHGKGQFLTGHGCFRAWQTPTICPYCSEVNKNATYVLFRGRKLRWLR